jgi:hypothetical protein
MPSGRDEREREKERKPAGDVIIWNHKGFVTKNVVLMMSIPAGPSE